MITQNFPDRVHSFEVYSETGKLLGMTDAQLPSFEGLTETLKGAGIAGEIDIPLLGSFGSMTLGLNWRVPNPDMIFLSAQKTHAISLNAALQVVDGGGNIDIVPYQVFVKGMPKKADLGKMEVGSTSDTSVELELIYIKVIMNYQKIIEVDKLNYKAYFGGDDLLDKVRAALWGL